jgi:non-ribosomal peptide synthetase component F
MASLALVKGLTSRLSGASDIRIATMAANRSVRGTEGLIGLFANTLVVRTRLEPTASYRELLRLVRRTVLNAFENQELPFELLLQTMEVEQSQFDRAAVAPMLFLWQQAPPPLDGQEEFTARPLNADCDAHRPQGVPTRFVLIWELEHSDRGLHARITYQTALFTRTSIDAMAAAFQHLLMEATACPDHPLASIRLDGDT